MPGSKRYLPAALSVRSKLPNIGTNTSLQPKALSQLNVPGFKQSDVDAFIDFLRTQHRNDIVLLVGHRETVPALLKALGHPVEIEISETEFDNLFVLTPKADGPPTVLRLRYEPENS